MMTAFLPTAKVKASRSHLQRSSNGRKEVKYHSISGGSSLTKSGSRFYGSLNAKSIPFSFDGNISCGNASFAQIFTPENRKSILECHVNPYDLVQGSDDDDVLPAITSKDTFKAKLRHRAGKILSRAEAKKEILSVVAGQRMKIFGEKRDVAEHVEDWVDDAEAMAAMYEPQRPPRREKCQKRRASSVNHGGDDTPMQWKCKSILKKPLIEAVGDVPSDTGALWRDNFYLSTFKLGPKVKKQVQFKGMHVDDESCCCRKDVAIVASKVETGYLAKNVPDIDDTGDWIAVDTAVASFNLSSFACNDGSEVSRNMINIENTKKEVIKLAEMRQENASSSQKNSGGIKSDCGGVRRSKSDCYNFPQPSYVIRCNFMDTMQFRVRSKHPSSISAFESEGKKKIRRPDVPPPSPPVILGGDNNVTTFLECTNNEGRKCAPPAVPPRQFFPFAKSANLIVSAVQSPFPNRPSGDEVSSLTRTFLRNKFAKEVNRMDSIIKIDANRDGSNKTIVTICPFGDKSSTHGHADNGVTIINIGCLENIDCYKSQISIQGLNDQNNEKGLFLQPRIDDVIENGNGSEDNECGCDEILVDARKKKQNTANEEYATIGNELSWYEDCENVKMIADVKNGEGKIRNPFRDSDEMPSSVLVTDLDEEDGHYELMEPIYEEIWEKSPQLSPEKGTDEVEMAPKSIFGGASKDDILKFLATAKERCILPSEELELLEGSDMDSGGNNFSDLACRGSHFSDSSDELLGLALIDTSIRRYCSDIERNDSGVGSETSKCSRSKWQHPGEDAQHICEDCDQVIEHELNQNSSDSRELLYGPLVCRKCLKKRAERREVIGEIVETEEKYGRDLRIIMEEFYKPMLVAGLLSPDQLSAIFLNVGELLEHNVMLAEKLRDGYEIALEHGDEDFVTFNVGKIFLDSAAPMLRAFETYCTRQAGAALLLATLEKEKELLKIFLRVSQMENIVLRRMNLNSFLMVPVQRVTKYPLLLVRLYKAIPEHQTLHRDVLVEARCKIQSHLEHINSLAKDITSVKLWRRISMGSGRRVCDDADNILNIKLQKLAVEALEWSHEEVKFPMEGRLLFSQTTDGNWKRNARNVKLMPLNAVLVTLGKPNENYNPEGEDLLFPPRNGIREVSLVLFKEKNGKYSLQRDPMFLDRCILSLDSDWENYFEIQEITSNNNCIFKGENAENTKRWYRQLQYHIRGVGCWRKRRNALANIMINGMQIRK